MSLSYSHLSAYRTCPRKFEYAFVKKLKQPLTPATCFGISMHSALAKWGKMEVSVQKSGSGQKSVCRSQEVARSQWTVGSDQSSLFTEEREATKVSKLALSALINLWNESFVIDGYESKVAADFDRKRGEVLIKKFYDWWGSEKRCVVGVEKGFRMKLSHDGTVITGRFDRVEELEDRTLRIIDFKTTMPRSQEEVDLDMQLSIYTLASGEAFKKEAKELVMLYLHDEELTEVHTVRSKSELATAAKTIQLFSDRIASGDYVPTPSVKKCRSCPYRRVCDASVA